MPSSEENTSCLLCKNKAVCFNKLNHTELNLTNDHRVEIKFRKGETIAKQGSFATNIFFIKSGLAKVYIEVGDNEKNLILNILGSGNLIGLPSLYGNNVFNFSASAIEDTVICSIEKSIVRNLIKQNGDFASEIIRTMNECSVQSYNRLVSLTQKQMNGRLADALIYLAESVFQSNSFKLSLTRKDLAELTSMSTMSVVHIIKDFKENGIIRNDGGMVEITDMDLLKRISKIG
jgi:CRP/FNR family transcriptional regulator